MPKQIEAMFGEQRLDIWLTQDALDADNLPTTKLTAIYAIQMLKWYKTVHIWCEVSTATRSLSRPRLIHSVNADGTLFLEKLLDGTTAKDHNIDDIIQEDTKLCQAYDACLLLVILRDTVSTYENIHLHIVMGGYPIQKLPDPLIPNTFLFVNLNAKTIRTIQDIIDTQDRLEGTANKDIYDQINREPWKDGEKVTVVYNQDKDLDFLNRRKRFHTYIKEQVKSFNVLNNEEPSLFYKSVDRAIDSINSVSSDINILAFAPLTNTAKLVTKLRRKSRVKKLVGHLLSLEPSDNFAGVQWNEYLDLSAAKLFYNEIQKWEHKSEYFFTPTQCFIQSKNPKFKLQKNATDLKEIMNACCMVSCDKTNIFLGFQKLWNLSKANQLKIKPALWTTKGEIVYDPLAMLYLLESLDNENSNALITKFMTCKCVFNEICAPPTIILDYGKLRVPDLREENCINNGVIKSYLTAYDVTFDHQKAVELIYCLKLLEKENNEAKKLVLKNKLFQLQKRLKLESNFPVHVESKWLLIVIFLIFISFFYSFYLNQ